MSSSAERKDAVLKITFFHMLPLNWLPVAAAQYSIPVWLINMDGEENREGEQERESCLKTAKTDSRKKQVRVGVWPKSAPLL